MLRSLARSLARICLQARILGMENFPRQGPGLVVCNHLGDADVVLLLAHLPAFMEPLAKVELRRLPVLGWLMSGYGVIWVRRSRSDREPLRSALEAFARDRWVALAPEGRESLTGSLEEGLGGAAFLALKAEAPIVPVAFTGTENWRVIRSLARLRRPEVTMTVGRTFRLETAGAQRDARRLGTRRIMTEIARLLPPAYQGVYRQPVEWFDGRR
jgi:1-acyl-sn-glycerol-3-phosphate acyltransferase